MCVLSSFNVAVNVTLIMSKAEKKDGIKDGDPNKMKLDKESLKQLIREQLANEIQGLEVGKDTTADVRRDAMAQAQAQAGSGLSDEERNLIKQVVGLLTQSGMKTNLLSGDIALKLKQLVPVLQKVVGEPAKQGDAK